MINMIHSALNEAGFIKTAEKRHAHEYYRPVDRTYVYVIPNETPYIVVSPVNNVAGPYRYNNNMKELPITIDKGAPINYGIKVICDTKEEVINLVNSIGG